MGITGSRLLPPLALALALSQGSPGPLLQPARPVRWASPPLPSNPRALSPHAAPGPFHLAPQSRAWELGLSAFGPNSASGLGTLGLSFPIYDRRGKSHLWSRGGSGETELIPSLFLPKGKRTPSPPHVFLQSESSQCLSGTLSVSCLIPSHPTAPLLLYSRPAAGRARDFSLCLKCGCLWERQPIKTRPAHDP